MLPHSGSDWQHVTCPKCRSYGFLSALEYVTHLDECKGEREWQLTPDDVTFLKCQRIDPEVESE